MATKPVDGIEGGIADDQIITSGDEHEGESDDRDSDIPLITPDTIITGEPDPGDEPRKRRGRKPGAKYGSYKSKKETTSDITALLVSCHFMLSKLLDVSELEIEEAEAKKVSDAAVRVARLYSDRQLPEKAMAWINLTFACGTVYGPRVVAYKNRKSNEAAKKKGQIIDASTGRVI